MLQWRLIDKKIMISKRLISLTKDRLTQEKMFRVCVKTGPH